MLVKRIVLTLVLGLLGLWLLHHSWQERKIFYNCNGYSAKEASSLKGFPKAQYVCGLKAWFGQDAPLAARFFKKAVARDILFVDAWLRLAEAEKSMGHLSKAWEILIFTDNLIAPVVRWKWAQTLLAQELGAEEIFWRNINFLIARQKMVSDTFQLMDSHTKDKKGAALKGLRPYNLVPYLKWLMRWGRTADTHAVWQKITAISSPEHQILLQYVHFLIGKKCVVQARNIWQKFTGIQGLTNSGFEHKITGQGFDWRFRNHSDGNWRVQRVAGPNHQGDYALEVSFAGKKNLSFNNLYQVVPVNSKVRYRLSYWWKSDMITTDQRPFVEIYPYKGKGLYQKGPMIAGTRDWHSVTIEFVPPEGCEAVVVRLRRLLSHRFDCKIAGRLWLDHFSLETPGLAEQKTETTNQP